MELGARGDRCGAAGPRVLPTIFRTAVPSLWIEFEPWDLIDWLWPVVGLLVVVEWLLWVRRGRGRQRRRRAILGGALLIATALGLWALGLSSRGGNAGPVACLAVLAAVWSLRAYASTTRPLERREKLLLLSLRAAAIGAILLVLARPVVRWTRFVEERGTIAVVLDDSRSMTVRDVAAGPNGPMLTRVEQLQRLLREQSVSFDRLARTRDLQTYLFDVQVREGRPEHVTGQGPFTALASAVREARVRAAGGGRRLVGILLMSDGGENFSDADPISIAGQLAQAGIPLWAVGLGSELPAGQTRRLVARRLDAPARVAVLNRLTVRAELLALGLGGQTVDVELFFDDQKVDGRSLTPQGPRELLSCELEHTPTVPGLHRITLRATAPDLDPDRRVVSLSQFVHVTKDFVHVLYIDRPRYERSAIARALEPAKDIRLTKVQAGLAASAAGRLLPRKREEWAAYDVILLGDMPRGGLYASQAEAIRDLVREHGHGLLMIGGRQGLGAGALADTPVADVLPVPASSGGKLPGPVTMVPTPSGLSHPICRFGGSPEETARLWASLPAAPEAFGLGEPKSAAAVLLATPSGRPILVVQEVGAGRSAVLAMDSTWQWPLQAERGPELHGRFWRQLILWLANRRPGVWVTTNQPRYELPRLAAGTEALIVRAGMVTFGQTGPPRVELRGQIVEPGGSRQPLSFLRRADEYEARPDIRREGEYRIEVEATLDGIPVEPAQTAVVVESPDIEMQEATANFDLLRQMVGRTQACGGAFVTAEHAGRLFEQILATPHTVRRDLSYTTNLTDAARWPLLVMAAGALLAEWVLRKRRGLA